MHTKNFIVRFLLLMLVSIPLVSIAQSNSLEKKIAQIEMLTSTGELAKAEKMVGKILNKYPFNGQAWDLLANIYYKYFEQSKSSTFVLSDHFAVIENGKEVKDSARMKSIDFMLNNFSLSDAAYLNFMYILRKGTLRSLDALNSSSYLRLLNIENDPDPDISEKTLRYFTEAKWEFDNKNYDAAIELYEKIVDSQPDFYKAYICLGNSYALNNNYREAINTFENVKKIFPQKLEPYKILIDIYGRTKNIDSAINEAFNALTIYPDYLTMKKAEYWANMNNKKVKIQWTQRELLPRKVNNVGGISVIEDSDNSKEINKISQSWKYYKNALNKIRPYCDTNGIITQTNSLTQSKYVEVYRWEEMLQNSNDTSLNEARRMQRLGYLDCYVLVTCFHYDFYYQYHDFALNNKQKIIEYYQKFTN